MRIDGQCKPAPHHYVEALFKKSSYPNLECYLRIDEVEVSKTNYRVQFSVMIWNWTPLQNEEQLSFRILTDVGRFERRSAVGFTQLYRSEGAELVKENAKAVFYYGEPYRDGDVLIFSKKQLRAIEYTANIVIAFGGRFSPRKISEYKLNFKTIGPHGEKLIVDRHENLLLKEKQDGIGATKEKSIAVFLRKGRK
jgi:hypothetical protein